MVPKPQKQTQFSSRRAYDPSKQVKLAIQWQIRPYAPREPLTTPLSVDITFYLPIPKGTAKLLKSQMINQTVYPIKRPDIDNLAYIVTNAMKEIVYADDSQVVDLILHKRYSEKPKTVIKVLEL
jgi:Holliday junction resolvase RusA-like endonuclease